MSQLIKFQDRNGKVRQMRARAPSPIELQQIFGGLGQLSRADVAKGNGHSQCSECKAGLSKNEVRSIIRTEIRSAMGDVNGGRVTFGDRDQYTPGGRSGGKAGKGGVLASAAATLTDGAAAGSEFVAEWEGTNLARMTGEHLCSVTALFDTDLLEFADHLEFEFLINDDEIEGLDKIPGDYIAKTASGEIQRWSLNGYKVPYDSVIGFRVRVVHDLPTVAEGGPSNRDVRLRVETGESCPT